MPREKANYRDMLSFLVKEQNVPLILDKNTACHVLGVSRNTLYTIISEGGIKLDNGRITVGSLARYLCD